MAGQHAAPDSGSDAISVLPATQYSPLGLLQVGMRAAVRDVQEYITQPGMTFGLAGEDIECIDVRPLKAYLLALLITSGLYDEPEPLLDPVTAADPVGDVDGEG